MHNADGAGAGVVDSALHDFRSFVYSNSVLSGAAGMILGLATKELVEKVTQSLAHFYGPRVQKLIPRKAAHLASVAWIVLVWFLTILISYIILEYVFNRGIMGLKSVVKNKDKPDFVAAAAQRDGGVTETYRQERYTQQR
jgi:large-conductance mechanosensitive channel